jgi:alkylhydroperoxidase/carboxymuconolactone decarboxylase family protein YurZ
MTDQAAMPVLDLVSTMTQSSMEAATLDLRTQVMLRLAALVAQDAAPASYMFNLEAGGELGLTAEDVQQVLITLAPLVGTARVVSAASKVARALGLAVAITDARED